MTLQEGDLYPDHITDDLAKSGLAPTDMRVRVLGANEREATGTPAQVDGYVIPYFDIRGKPVSFYRVRLYDYNPKYRQLSGSHNYVYFPPGFWPLINDPKCKGIMITEGEKKAACAVKQGFACVALGGVESWRNRVMTMPKETQLATQGKTVVAKLPSGSEATEKIGSLAQGMFDLINVAITRNLPILICYDSDHGQGLKAKVQAAAAVLGFELRFRGIPMENIRQLTLRAYAAWGHEKIGLDDYLMDPKLGPKALGSAINVVLARDSAFPRHPNVKEYVNKKLERSRMPRAQMQALSTSILCDIDAYGARLRSPDDDTLFYFHRPTHELLPVSFRMKDDWTQSPFAVHLYRKYNLGSTDSRIIQWLATQYSGERPIKDVRPERVLTTRGDAVYYQLSSSEMVKITADSIAILDNGSDDILFQADSVEPVNITNFQEELQGLKDQIEDEGDIPNHWYSVLQEARVKDDENNRSRKMLSLLYSISPWFYRWRGTQLPVEMMIAEPGSGKSTLYTLRLDILTGNPKLRNAPNDLKDWTASVAATGGLHVTDNVHMPNSSMRQELSDELCRIVTEPDPHIERRKLYSDNDLVLTPVKAVFAFTALKQPFTNADIIQRSIIAELDKGEGNVEYEAGWENRQLDRFGGREGWLAYHIIFIQALLKKVKKKWNPKYGAKYRLINVEQLLILAAEVYGWDASWVSGYLEETKNQQVATGDFALEGLREYSREWVECYGNHNVSHRFSAAEIAEWAKANEDYQDCTVLINSRSLGKYMTSNKNLLATIAGIQPAGSYANRQVYVAFDPKSESPKDKIG